MGANSCSLKSICRGPLRMTIRWCEIGSTGCYYPGRWWLHHYLAEKLPRRLSLVRAGQSGLTPHRNLYPTGQLLSERPKAGVFRLDWYQNYGFGLPYLQMYPFSLHYLFRNEANRDLTWIKSPQTTRMDFRSKPAWLFYLTSYHHFLCDPDLLTIRRQVLHLGIE